MQVQSSQRAVEEAKAREEAARAVLAAAKVRPCDVWSSLHQ